MMTKCSTFRAARLRRSKRSGLCAIAAIAAVLTALSIHSSSTAQMRIDQGGHALDASLQLGSGGFNTSARDMSSLRSPRYQPGMTRPLFVPDPSGRLVYSQHNAFNPTSRYTATGYRSNYRSHESHRRFRY